MPSYTPKPIRELFTDRLHLVPIQEADAARVQELFPNPNVLRYMATTIPQPYPVDGAISFIRRALEAMADQKEYHWAIKLDGEQIGSIGPTPDSDEDSRGFWLAEEYWGKGYMREAVVAVNDFAFDDLELDFMLLNNAQPNRASSKLKESLGAQLISVEDKNFIGGRFPSEHWRLTAGAWRNQRPRRQ